MTMPKARQIESLRTKVLNTGTYTEAKLDATIGAIMQSVPDPRKQNGALVGALRSMLDDARKNVTTSEKQSDGSKAVGRALSSKAIAKNVSEIKAKRAQKAKTSIAGQVALDVAQQSSAVKAPKYGLLDPSEPSPLKKDGTLDRKNTILNVMVIFAPKDALDLEAIRALLNEHAPKASKRITDSGIRMAMSGLIDRDRVVRVERGKYRQNVSK